MTDTASRPPILDQETLNSLRELASEDQPDFLKGLLDLFLQTSPGRMDIITTAARNGDFTRLAQEAHSLKSSSANLGGLRMAEICRELEKLGKAPTTPEAAIELSSRLRTEYAQMIREIAALPEMRS